MSVLFGRDPLTKKRQFTGSVLWGLGLLWLKSTAGVPEYEKPRYGAGRETRLYRHRELKIPHNTVSALVVGVESSLICYRLKLLIARENT